MASKPTIPAPTSDEIRANDARKRLRQARTAVGLTPEELALAIGRAASTVRAHENGQNKITAEMADAYAAALCVSPAWLLWGEGPAQPALESAEGARRPAQGRPRAVAVAGKIEDRVRGSERPSRERYVYVDVPDYDDFELRAFTVAATNRMFNKGDFVVIAPVGAGVRDGDVVVTKIDVEHGSFFSLHQLTWTTAGTYLRGVSSGASDLRSAQLPAGVVERQFKNGAATIEGVVVAYGGRERPSSGRILSPDRISSVLWAK